MQQHYTIIHIVIYCYFIFSSNIQFISI